MKIRLIVTGKVKERFTQEWLDEFLKRLPKYASFSVLELKEQANLDLEAEKILPLLKPEDYIIVLDSQGKQLASEELAELLKQKLMEKNLVFVIGSDKGLSEAVKQKAHFKLSLSKMTFTHQIVRLLLVEQIYRALTIIKGEKYHK